MSEYLSPGVFIQERESQLQQITSVSTSNFATMGWTEKGPTNQAILITSLKQFFDVFGGFSKYSDLHYGIVGFFQSGGTRAYVVRVVPSDALKASGDISTFWSFEAYSEGAWGNNVQVQISGNSNYYTPSTATYTRFDVTVLEESADGEGDFSVVETFEALSLDDEDDANYIETIINSETLGSNYVTVSKLSGGIPTTLQSTEVSNESIGSGDNVTQDFIHTLALPTIALDTLQIKVNGILQAIDDGEGNIEGVSGVGVTGTIDYDTGSLVLFFVAAPSGGASITADYYQAPVDNVSVDLTGGSDGSPDTISRTEISSPTLAEDKLGIYAFDEVEEFLNIGLMDFSDDNVISADLIAYAQTRKDCFVVLDVGPSKTSQQALKYKRQTLNNLSNYAAIYWPRIKVANVLKNNIPKVVSPVGHIIGRYAYTDINKTVGKAPAGINDGQLNGIIELEFKTTKGDRDLIYPASINPLIENAVTGRSIWGAKTLAITGDFTRIHVRRLFIFLEKSIFNSTHDLVFENIGPQLFSKVKLRLDGFLTVLYQDGFFGSESTTPEDAFKVIVDESNNTPESIAASRLVVDVLVRPNQSAEFVIFTFERLVNQQ